MTLILVIATHDGECRVRNTDPYAATEPTADNEWGEFAPNIVIITPDAAALEGMPSDPENGGPWVMWRGTPYAHIIIPLGAGH